MPDDIKERILDAAFVEFATHGRAGARTKAIAERAAVNKALINYYFTNKQQLYMEVMTSKMRQLSEVFGLHSQSVAEPRQLIRRLVEVYNRILDENPLWVKLLLHTYLDEEIDLLQMFQKANFHTEMVQKLQLMIDAGVLREKDPFHVMLHLISLNVHAYLFKPVMEKICPPAAMRGFQQDRTNSVIDLLENGLFTD